MGATRAKTRILIVDDHPVLREAMRNAFEQHEDMEVLGEAGDGEEAVRLTSELKPDIVIMDIVMPKLSGKDTFYRLKKIAPSVPIVIASGFTKTEAVSDLLRDGAAAFMSKPFRLQDLSREVGKHISRTT